MWRPSKQFLLTTYLLTSSLSSVPLPLYVLGDAPPPTVLSATPIALSSVIHHLQSSSAPLPLLCPRWFPGQKVILFGREFLAIHTGPELWLQNQTEEGSLKMEGEGVESRVDCAEQQQVGTVERGKVHVQFYGDKGSHCFLEQTRVRHFDKNDQLEYKVIDNQVIDTSEQICKKDQLLDTQNQHGPSDRHKLDHLYKREPCLKGKEIHKLNNNHQIALQMRAMPEGQEIHKLNKNH
uniref:Uncharacterized protein n=1 Tax=Timema monikensis TaxID=170555 RepID=A0A7R9EE97_9NEOP|nr:unnamed protein product [Timema monikensis]